MSVKTADHSTAPGFASYWQFYWPLAIAPMLALISMQVLNAILARYPNAERELAVFAFAVSTLFIVEIATIFLTQTVTVFGRSPLARVRVYRFCLATGLMLAMPIVFLAITPWGHRVLSVVYNVSGAMLDDLASYLIWLSPGVILRTHFQFFSGLLAQIKRTRLVSFCAFSGVIVSVYTAVYGFSAGWPPMQTLVSAQLAMQVTFCSLAGISFWRVYRAEDKDDFETPGYMEIFRFFWPVCLSGMSFGASRPLLYVFVSRTPDAIPTIAALRISFDFFMLMQMAVNQFRSIIPSLGIEDLRGKRKFMLTVAGGVTLMMLLSTLPPIDQFLFGRLFGLEGRLYDQVQIAVAVFVISPAVLTVRNYFHGIMLYTKRTGAMAVGSAFRMGMIALAAALLLHLGWLNAATAPMVMILSFVAESSVAAYAGSKALRCHRKKVKRQSAFSSPEEF